MLVCDIMVNKPRYYTPRYGLGQVTTPQLWKYLRVRFAADNEAACCVQVVAGVT